MRKQKWDVFISYAHEDKWFVGTLANVLVSMGLKVWYDQFILELGDSLTKKITEGLSNSTYGIVVLSRSFFKKNWTQVEIAALLNKEINNKKVIIPIWHDISKKELEKSAPLFIDKLAANSNDNAEKIGQQILKIVYPERFKEQNLIDPIEVDYLEGNKLIILPCHPFKNKVIGISKYPVTNKQYKKYLTNLKKGVKDNIKWMIRDIDGYSDDENKIFFNEPVGKIYNGDEWNGPFYPWSDNRFKQPNKPVVCISLFEAMGYSIWMNSVEKKITSLLPIPELWDYAAFGKIYPERKSSSWLQTVKTIHQEEDAPADILNNGERINSRGISDMFGNIWEWCQPINPNNSGFAILGRSRNPIISAELRGGGYLDNLNQISPFITTSLLEDGLETRHTDLGCRMAALITTNKLEKEILDKLWTCKDSTEPFLKKYQDHH